MTAPTVVVHADERTVALATAARLVTRLVDVQAARGSASLVLTGGGIVNASLAAVAGSALRDTVDWSRLDLWWGDERFLPSGDPERNETLAREALLDSVPVDPSRVHPMAASDGPDGDDPEAAAARYAEELAAAARPEDHADAPSFDVCLLGVGPDGQLGYVAFAQHQAMVQDHDAIANKLHFLQQVTVQKDGLSLRLELLQDPAHVGAADRIDAGKASRLVQLLYYLIAEIGNDPMRPRWVPARYREIVQQP